MLHTASLSSASTGPVVLHDVSWPEYEGLLKSLGNKHPSLRLTYLEGSLEIMTTSPEHERIKTLLARLVEIWAMERDVQLEGYGSATFRRKAAKRGLEPDECYVLGGKLVDVPDIAIEVVHRHGGIDKLAVYQGLGVPEVWFWENETVVPYVLGKKGYRKLRASRLLPDLDLAQLGDFVRGAKDQTSAVKAFRAALLQ